MTGLEIVTPDGDLVRLGGKAPDPPGYDLLGAFVGSEGTLGIATEVTVRLMRLPESVRTLLAAFARHRRRPARPPRRSSRRAWCPAAIEMMDALAIEAAEAAVHCGYPAGAGAVLIVELDGPAAEVEAQFAQVERAVRGARRVRDPDRRRRRRAGAVLEGPQVGVRRGRPDQPGLHRAGRRDPADRAAARCCARIGELAAATHGVRVANVFHAGDGNLHPLVLFDDAVPGAGRAGRGGRPGRSSTSASSTAGRSPASTASASDKAKYMPRMFTADDLDTMQLVRCAFDPDGLANPGKVFPTPRLCGEVPGPAQRRRIRWPRPGWRRSSDGASLDATLERDGPATATTDAVGGVPARLVAAPASTDEAAASADRGGAAT